MTPRKGAPARPKIREAEEDDAEPLAEFECSTGALCEDEVQKFVREKALKCATQPAKTGYKLFVVEEAGRLIGCAGFHPEHLLFALEKAVPVTRLQLLAVALDQRGRRFEDHERLVDFIVHTVVVDSFREEGHGVLSALVSRDNGRGITAISRAGLDSQIGYDDKFVRLTGTFEIV